MLRLDQPQAILFEQERLRSLRLPSRKASSSVRQCSGPRLFVAQPAARCSGSRIGGGDDDNDDN